MQDVDDVKHWLASQKREEIFKDVAFDMVAFVHPTEPNKAGISANIPDPQKFLEINNGPIGETSMKHHGVHADTIFFMVEA